MQFDEVVKESGIMGVVWPHFLTTTITNESPSKWFRQKVTNIEISFTSSFVLLDYFLLPRALMYHLMFPWKLQRQTTELNSPLNAITDLSGLNIVWKVEDVFCKLLNKIFMFSWRFTNYTFSIY